MEQVNFINNETEILETLSSKPSDFKVCAIGDKKRYNANKLLLGDKCRYDPPLY